MNIKSISPSRINLKNLIVITQVSWNAMNIHNSKDCLLTLYFLFSYFGNNRAAFMDIKRASAPHNHQHGSSAVLRLGEKSYSHHHLTGIVIPSNHSSSSYLLDQPRKPYWYYHV
jgi:hypothetical protein